MGWRGGETPLAILFFFLREKRDVSGSDFFGAYYGVKKSSLTPLTFSLLLHLVFMRLAELSPGISNVGVALAGQRVGIPISRYVRVAWFQQARLQVEVPASIASLGSQMCDRNYF